MYVLYAAPDLPGGAAAWTVRCLNCGRVYETAAANLSTSRTSGCGCRRLLAPGPTPVYDWAAVDWARRDIDIAADLGCTHERVGQVRRDRGRPPSPDHRKSDQYSATVALVRQNPEMFATQSNHQLVRSGMTPYRSPQNLSRALRDLGVVKRPPPRPDTLPPLNWDLPSQDLDRVWRMAYNRAAIYRYRRRAPPPRWHYVRGSGAAPSAPAYAAALAAEVERAAAWRAEQGRNGHRKEQA